ncbi:FecR domain-containing protein [Croceibacterium sp. TMG7-5b_MA50]|uniref:FecR family protein n=1 Tax=Croceibacterium sp. TMG7-5b_MA50 TaxID=3121290 RepID=UPI003221D64B
MERLLEARASGSDADWDAIYRWIEEDPAHGVAFARAEASWDLAERLREDPAYHDQPVAEPIAAPRTIHPWTRWGWPAAAIAACVAMVGIITLQFGMAVDTYHTAIGQRRTVQLADGSAVTLNTGSAIEVALTDRTRAVTLLRGEASFTVAPDRQRPFVVTTDGLTVHAIGTAFNVRLRPQLTEVTVTEGVVAINGARPDEQLVRAGRAAAVRPGAVAVTSLRGAEIDRRLAWRGGKLSFDGDTLEQAVAEFNRYRTSPIVIGDPALAGLRIGGTFRADGSDDFAEALGDLFGIRVLRGQDGSLLLVATEQ